MAAKRKDDRRTVTLRARFTEAESASVTNRAEASGVSVSDLLRFGGLGEQPPARRRGTQPVRDHAELARLLAAVGHIGGNVNQLAYKANAGSWPETRLLHEASADIQWMRRTLMLALGIREEPTQRPQP